MSDSPWLRLTLPSSNRRCGLPASGSPENSRLRHAQAPTDGPAPTVEGAGTTTPPSADETAVGCVVVNVGSGDRARTSQSPSKRRWELRNFLRHPRLLHRFRPRLSCGCPILRSGIFFQAGFSSSYICMFSVRPLGSTGVTPLLRYYGPPRLPFRDVADPLLGRAPDGRAPTRPRCLHPVGGAPWSRVCPRMSFAHTGQTARHSSLAWPVPVAAHCNWQEAVVDVPIALDSFTVAETTFEASTWVAMGCV